MKRYILSATLLLATFCLQGFAPADDTMTRQDDGTYIVNTTELGKNIEGYNGPVPLKIHILKNKVVKVEVLRNSESPKYLAQVKKALLEKWNGMKVKDARRLKVDAVTGATYSSEALIKNVELGLDYYVSHK